MVIYGVIAALVAGTASFFSIQSATIGADLRSNLTLIAPAGAGGGWDGFTREQQADVPVGLNALVPWFRPTIAVGLHDGIGETDVASAFEVYNMSFAARTVPMAATETVTTRHGMVLLTVQESKVPQVDKVIVPGTARDQDIRPQLREWAASHDVPIEAFAGADGVVGFDGALEYHGRHTDHATALSAAKMIDYPTAHLNLPAGGTYTRVPVLIALGLLLAIVVSALPAVTATAVRRRAEGKTK